MLDWRRQLWNSDEEFETKVKLDDLEDEEESGLKPRVRHHRGEPTDEDFAAMDDTDWPPLCREITELRERINAMGAVNLVAIEEYAELRERHNFLKTQSDDLWAAKNELTGAIDEINKTSQQLFADTFEQIRKNFKFTFDRLFNGGEADLQLIAADDPLDSGIEITARPPGTKLRSLTLLSGGQKTMTAVGLLFAIYMVKPSPFCVLDELRTRRSTTRMSAGSPTSSASSPSTHAVPRGDAQQAHRVRRRHHLRRDDAGARRDSTVLDALQQRFR